MPETVTALGGASFTGPATGVQEMPPPGMVTLRADLADPAVAAAVEAATGCPLPGRRGIETGGDNAVAWMSPDELLLLVAPDEAGATVAALSQALGEGHFLAVEVSDARALLRIDGSGARDVLARLCPTDLSPEAFAPGEVRRTRLAQVPAAFWIGPDGAFRLVCFRSVARYAFDVLKGAAASAPTGFFAR